MPVNPDIPLLAFERKVRWANTAVLAANAWLWTGGEGWVRVREERTGYGDRIGSIK